MIVTIDKDAKDRLWAFIRAVKVEVGGMGYAFLQDDGSFHWRETFLIPQEVSASEVDFEKTGGDLHAIERAVADGVLDDPSFVWVSWHSHHTMNAFWSSTDDQRIAAMKQVGVKRLLSFVGCHDGSYEMRLDVFDVEAHGVGIGQVTVSSLSFEAEEAEPTEFERLIASEIGANVTEKKLTTFTTVGTRDIGPFSSSAGSLGDSFSKSAREEMEERRVVAELTEEGYSRKDAEDLLAACGIEEVEDMLNYAVQSRGGKS